MTGQQEVHAATDGAIRRTRSMTYDLAGRVLQERETGGSDARDDNAGADEVVSYAYDALSRILSETASGRTVAYQYDENSNRTQIMWPDGFAVNYAYDTLNRLEAVTLADGTFLADYEYDLRSRLKDGFMGNSSVVSFGYNTDSELTNLLYDVSTEAGADEALAWDYLYTAAGRLQQTALTDAFHPEWSPTESTVVSYGSANVLDQYTSVSGRGAMSYDQRGNTTGDERGRSYAYDLYNRLTGAVVGGVPIIYDYDVAGRRVGKSVGGEETRFLHAGDMEIAEYDSAGTLLRRYIPGGAVDQRVAMIEGASVVPAPSDFRYYHADRLGNVAALTDGNGRVTDRYAYDPFGNEITGAATSGNPFRYTGRRYDPETGLYFYRARYYDAELGRFLQTDPIGYADQWNLYTYVANDPLLFTDPSGQDGCHAVYGCGRDQASTQRRLMQENPQAPMTEFEKNLLGTVADFTPFVGSGKGVYDFFKAPSVLGAVGIIPYGKVFGKVGKLFRRSPCGCFVSGTLVETEAGLRPIENVEIGDLVLARDPETGETTLKPVTDLIRLNDRIIWEIEFTVADGVIQRFETTDDHPWWNEELGWLRTEQLSVGTIIETVDSDKARVISITKTDRVNATYNFEVADFHTYFVGEEKLLVHNGPCASAAAKRLGINLDDVSIVDGVANIRIRQSRSLLDADLGAVKHFLGGKGAKNVTINSGEVINPRLANILGKKADAGRKFKGFDVFRTGNPNNAFILTGAID